MDKTRKDLVLWTARKRGWRGAAFCGPLEAEMFPGSIHPHRRIVVAFDSGGRVVGLKCFGQESLESGLLRAWDEFIGSGLKE